MIIIKIEQKKYDYQVCLNDNCKVKSNNKLQCLDINCYYTVNVKTFHINYTRIKQLILIKNVVIYCTSVI